MTNPTKQFQKQISKALRGETDAIRLYSKMISMTCDTKIQETLKEIRKDEADHHRLLLIMRDKLRWKKIIIFKYLNNINI